MSRRVPKLCRHKATGQAYVTDPATRKEVYFGPWGSARAERDYGRWLLEFLARAAPRTPVDGKATVVQLLAAYLDHADVWFRKRGKPTSQIGVAEATARRVRNLYADLLVDDFGPRQLKAVREALVRERLARKTINQYVSQLVRIWRWGVGEELVNAATLQALEAVPGLPKGRTLARETEAVGPVDPALVAKTLPLLRPVVRALVQLQEFTGMRPGEVCPLRPCELDRRREPWLYVPGTHKTEHEDRDRRIYLGPRARQLLEPFLERCPDPESWLFPSRAGKGRGCYSTSTYGKAVALACQKGGLPHWHPHQLRHSSLTEVRRRYGAEGSQVIAGHSNLSTTELYAEKDEDLARRIAEDLG